MKRHFTATAYVISGDATLLHPHPKLGMWLPPGGHIEENEDPVQAVLREVLEETGLLVDIISEGPDVPRFENPPRLTVPLTILVEDIDLPGDHHQHVDFIYVARPKTRVQSDPNSPWRWITAAELHNAAVRDVKDGQLAEDVRLLGLRAIALGCATTALPPWLAHTS